MTAIDEIPWDLVVIGGGAAGFFGAITAAERLADPVHVLILEKSKNLLGKVRISGGGRCNVTHACFDPKTFASHFPRGEKALIGPLHRWDARQTVDWFETRGVKLKTESDGRIFPITDDSQTIIDCLLDAASNAGIRIRTHTMVKEVTLVESENCRFQLHFSDKRTLRTRNLLIATGGTRSPGSERLLNFSEHSLDPPVPSLFTFNIPNSGLKDLAGLTIKNTRVSVSRFKLCSQGPILVTHWGLSGPAILKLSALGAREFHSADYAFPIEINWLPEIQLEDRLPELRKTQGKRSISSHSPFPELPRRLWQHLVSLAEIDSATTWSQLSRKDRNLLIGTLSKCPFQVLGKSMNKEEFVTCGGVKLDEVDLRTMESKRVPGLYFAGEVLNIDGVTGGFNFQNAWTTGFLAGRAISGE